MSSAVAATVLTYLPSPDQGVWYLGPIPIRAYALCIIVGIVVAVLWSERRFTAMGGAPGTVIDVAVYAVPFGLVGGRLYHVATDWRTYFGPGGNPIDALKIWQGGLGIWGAVALGAVGAWIGCRKRGVPLPAFADAVAPGIAVAQAIGRLGNWFNQELYGGPTTLPWGLEIYQRVDPATGAPDPLGGVALDRTPIEVVHPTFLYELVWDLLVAALVVWAGRRFTLGHGRTFALYVAAYTAGRFVIEQMRVDPATHVLGDLRINVVVSAVVFVGAVIYLVCARRGPDVLGPETGAPTDVPARAVPAAAAVPATVAAVAVTETVAAEPAGEPDVDEAAADGPATEESVADEAVADGPVVDEPVAAEPAADEPVVDEPVTAELVADGFVVAEPAVAEPAVNEPAVNEPAVDEPAVDEPVAVEEPVAEESIVIEPAADEATAAGPAVADPAVDEPTVTEPTVTDPAADEPATQQPDHEDEQHEPVAAQPEQAEPEQAEPQQAEPEQDQSEPTPHEPAVTAARRSPS